MVPRRAIGIGSTTSRICCWEKFTPAKLGEEKTNNIFEGRKCSEILKSVFSAHFTKKMLTVVYLKRVAAWAVLSGENWGSLLAINIEPMDAPDGFVSPTPKAAGKPKAWILIHTDSQPRLSWGEHSSACGMKNYNNLDSFIPCRFELFESQKEKTIETTRAT